MLLIDVSLRYGAIALLVLMAVSLLRGPERPLAAILGALLALSVAMTLATTVSDAFRFSWPVHAAMRLMDMTSMVLIWWFGRALFQDGFRLRSLEWTGFLAICLPGLMFRLRQLGFLGEPLPFTTVMIVWIDVVSLLMMAHVVWIIFVDRSEDLVEERRALRMPLGLATVAAGTATLLLELVMPAFYPLDVDVERTVRVIIIAPVVMWVAVALFRLRSDFFEFSYPQKASQKPSDSPLDKVLLGRLNDTMEQGLYREQGLTIRSLSETLRVPEHQLRVLINNGLGHRNFSAFLNSYRLEAARKALADPEQARTQVLTIAMDSGYASLAPFNRAFKDKFDETPTAYRRNVQAKADQN